jgi:lysophospholipase L1-like esterase
MTRPRPFRHLALAALIAGSTAIPAWSQEFVLRAFGDSITEGYGDPSSFNGYPARLERRLRQAGYDAIVTEHGVGGETTAQGLNRIDDVLALGGDYLLLMEGTNDISQHTGVETMRFNLDEMARRAEALGMVAVHGTCIPRIPTANTDANNAKTSALALAILEMGEEEFRPVADNFHEFESNPNLFEEYYYYDETVPDPVGHPNITGYNVITGVFFGVLRPFLDGPQLQIVPPSGPLAPGQVVDLSVSTNGTIGRVEWSFGDGGFAHSLEPPEFDTRYAWTAAGSFTVRATGYAPGGASVTDQIQVQLTGPPPAWGSRTVLIPAVASPADALMVTDLELGNASASPGIARLQLLADISYDTEPPTPKLFIPAGGDLVAEFLPWVFGVEGARGGVLVELVGPSSGAALSSEALLRAPEDDGGDGCSTGAIAQLSWSSATRQIPGITLNAGEIATVHVVNPGVSAGSVRLDLYDAVSSYVGSGIFDLAAASARVRELDDLFRGLAARPKPLRAVFSSSGVPFSAYLVTADGEEVRCAGVAP